MNTRHQSDPQALVAEVTKAVRRGQRSIVLSDGRQEFYQRIYPHSVRRSLESVALALKLAGIDLPYNQTLPRPRLRHVVHRAFEKLCQRDDWNIGVTSSRFLDLILRGQWPQFFWFAREHGDGFFADPMISDNWIYYEWMNPQTQRGEIQRVQWNGTSFSSREPFFTPDYHVSYPFVVEANHEKFIIPEQSSTGKTIAISEKTGASVEILDVGLVDPTLLGFDGRWYLFGGYPGPSELVALYGWSSDSPFGPFEMISSHPIVLNARGARMAGPFVRHNGSLFRFGQDCTHRYGGGIVVFEVLELTHNRYTERHVQDLRPSPEWPWNEGLHTISVGRDYIAIDALRRRVSLCR